MILLRLVKIKPLSVARGREELREPRVLLAVKVPLVHKGQVSLRGPQGPPGATGLSGIQGIQGPPGDVGPRGPHGQDGATGGVGPTGGTGSIGPMGETGVTGIVGATGEPGDKGPQGTVGQAGVDGAPGPLGETGLAGAQGAPGPLGGTGPAGAAGSDGLAGPQGATGPAGPAGATGSSGPVTLNYQTMYWNNGFNEIGPVNAPNKYRIGYNRANIVNSSLESMVNLPFANIAHIPGGSLARTMTVRIDRQLVVNEVVRLQITALYDIPIPSPRFFYEMEFNGNDPVPTTCKSVTFGPPFLFYTPVLGECQPIALYVIHTVLSIGNVNLSAFFIYSAP